MVTLRRSIKSTLVGTRWTFIVVVSSVLTARARTLSILFIFLQLICYSVKGNYFKGLLPVVQCFSCMSKNLQQDFQYLSRIYLPQKAFDDRCNEPFMDRNIPVVNCSNICITLKESESRLGVVLGYNYIRGCVDTIFVNGFLNKTALETHRFYFEDICRLLPWHQLMTSDFSKRPLAINGGGGSSSAASFYKSGDVVMCSCYGNKCNGAASSSDQQRGRFRVNRTIILFSALIFFILRL